MRLPVKVGDDEIESATVLRDASGRMFRWVRLKSGKESLVDGDDKWNEAAVIPTYVVSYSQLCVFAGHVRLGMHLRCG